MKDVVKYKLTVCFETCTIGMDLDGEDDGTDAEDRHGDVAVDGAERGCEGCVVLKPPAILTSTEITLVCCVLYWSCDLWSYWTLLVFEKIQFGQSGSELDDDAMVETLEEMELGRTQ